MRNLVVDIGNTLTKLAVFNDRVLSDLAIFQEFNAAKLLKYIDDRQFDHAIISSVEKEIEDLEHIVKSSASYCRFSASIKTSVINQYKTPQTLGLDRLAAVIGAQAIFPASNSMIIDAGSCITYDFVDKAGTYYGGSISPGISMRFQAMHTFTHRLPLVSVDSGFREGYGTDTSTSMISGVQNGVLNEALGFIGFYSSQYPDLQVVLCGGDVNFFDSRLKNSIFAHAVKTEPNLVLIGLNEVIYQQND